MVIPLKEVRTGLCGEDGKVFMELITEDIEKGF